MTKITQTGSLGRFSLSFTSNKINPKEFAEDFFGGNIKHASINEYDIFLINKQGKEIKMDLVELGLNNLEHLNEEDHVLEEFETMGI